MIHLKDFIVEAFINTYICEMADNRRDFKNKIKNYFPQVLENICLIIYAKENKQSENTINHWLTELNSYVYWLRKAKVKVTKKRIFGEALNELDFTIMSIKRTINKKFVSENFDVECLSYDSLKKIIFFIENIFPKICCSNFLSDDYDEQNSETLDLIVEEIENLFEIELQ